MVIRLMGVALFAFGALASRGAVAAATLSDTKIATVEYVNSAVSHGSSNAVQTDKNYKGDLSGTYNFKDGSTVNVSSGAVFNVPTPPIPD